jgi:hypothetical protein
MDGLQVTGVVDQGGYEKSPVIFKAVDRRGVLLDMPEMRVIQTQNRTEEDFGDHPMGKD